MHLKKKNLSVARFCFLKGMFDLLVKYFLSLRTGILKGRFLRNTDVKLLSLESLETDENGDGINSRRNSVEPILTVYPLCVSTPPIPETIICKSKALTSRLYYLSDVCVCVCVRARARIRAHAHACTEHSCGPWAHTQAGYCPPSAFPMVN